MTQVPEPALRDLFVAVERQKLRLAFLPDAFYDVRIRGQDTFARDDIEAMYQRFARDARHFLSGWDAGVHHALDYNDGGSETQRLTALRNALGVL
ncbi:hypothetical protein D869_gp040 [Caulobacter phage CcrRogue]|uniref:Uncharacterized protein n=1 Tax=Caulobacter phage CcrRogue TaxID=2927986 RepID=K4K2V6_9CAUD|nr:hypothetical protein D869_gp040 [Caulobacter phage CcrRogue]AFU86522.1 hypothetical protein CcrRogue_gp040 [Caulobacter phage CcrRogue]